jgi:hypothetical protein
LGAHKIKTKFNNTPETEPTINHHQLKGMERIKIQADVEGKVVKNDPEYRKKYFAAAGVPDHLTVEEGFCWIWDSCLNIFSAQENVNIFY